MSQHKKTEESSIGEVLFKRWLVKEREEDSLLSKLETVFGDKDKKLDRVRIIVLAIHFNLEQDMNLQIEERFLKSLDKTEKIFFEDELLSKISFSEKIEILRKMNIISNSLADNAKQINTLRNRLMHPTYKTPAYKGINIKEDKRGVGSVLKDSNEISECLLGLKDVVESTKKK